MKDRLCYWFKFFKIYKNWRQIIIARIGNRKLSKVILRNDVVIRSSKNSPLTVITDEVFLLNRYTNFPNVKVEKGDLVVDIGAHVGVFSLFASKNGASQVFSYEPDIKNYKLININCKNNNVNNVNARNLAVTGNKGTANLYLNGSDGRNSVFPKGADHNDYKKIKVKSITLDDAFSDEAISIIDFLKVDCEGSEGLIFQSTPIKTLKKIRKISMEYHNKISPLSHVRITKKLRGAGFIVKIFKLDNYFGYIYACR